MKKIGLIGGMSCESTLEYYKIINQEIRKHFGGCSSAKLIIESFNFKEIETLQFENKWTELGEMLANAAKNLENSGADHIMICTNLMHKVAPVVQKNIEIPLIHIADCVGSEIKKQGFNKVGILGTSFTMEENFYSQKLLDNYSIETIIPDKEDRQEISRIIYEELCQGIIKEESKQKYIDVIDKMKNEGAQGVILACTEIPLLIKEANIPTFDTAYIHAMSAVSKILKD